MAIRKILYPVDLTGSASSNRIENEYVTIGTDKYRTFTLNYAPFYADSLTIKERNKTTLLKEGTDYVVLYFYSEIAKLTGGKRLCGVVCVTNTAVGTDLVVGYNTIGGHYANCASLIEQAIFDLDLDNREAYWQNVIGKPELFQPIQHLHDIGDVYGLEFIIDCLIGLREAIIIGDNEVHKQIYDRITEAVNEFKSYHATHLSDYSNPHRTTAHQVGTYTQEEIDNLIESLLEDLAALEPRLKVITDGITDIYSKLSAVNGVLKSLSDRIGYVEQELSKFVLLLTPINETLLSLQGQIDNINTSIGLLQAKDVNLQEQIDALDGRLDTAEEELVKHGDRLDDLESEDVKLDGRLDTLETFKTTAEDATTGYDARLDKLETFKTAAEDTTTGYDARLDKLETWKGTQGTWNTNTTKSIDDLDTRIDTLENGSGDYPEFGECEWQDKINTYNKDQSYNCLDITIKAAPFERIIYLTGNGWWTFHKDPRAGWIRLLFDNALPSTDFISDSAYANNWNENTTTRSFNGAFTLPANTSKNIKMQFNNHYMSGQYAFGHGRLVLSSRKVDNSIFTTIRGSTVF